MTVQHPLGQPMPPVPEAMADAMRHCLIRDMKKEKWPASVNLSVLTIEAKTRVDKSRSDTGR
ncbi:hypothetical protein BCON_0105g00080 [Botryotinia convoluta]|uniref:Uncharacterized protein n=1 Tax=Botryotinia convoluta TaxID=54673 RepID=A0A4Z1HZ63_9HELO|nr:hypothetical protein BCON_0105g00080 [Botryotinia convoluta]